MRAYLAAVLAWTVAAAVVFLPLGGPGAQPARAAAGTTVEGPARWNPADWTEGPKGTVTLSRSTGLGNQVVHVSWTGFTPTVDLQGQPVSSVLSPRTGYIDKDALYPVRIYQCRGEHPEITDCYGSSLYNADPAKGFLQPSPAGGLTTPEFPSNMAIAATRPDGTGDADIEVWTAQQSQSLGCDPTHKCSIVVEPNYGGDPIGAYSYPDSQINCAEHSGDADFFFNTATDATLYTNMYRTDDKQYWSGEACAWSRHVTVPLEFAPTPAACADGGAAFSAIGLEMADRAVQQWRTGLCLAADPLNVQYNVGSGEPQARAGFLRGSGADVALTSLPDTGPPARPYVYAPLAAGAVSIVYIVDDGSTHQQVRRLRLNQRLLAKMLTQTYRSDATDTTDSVKGNPNCLFEDPEFRRLNADVSPNTTWLPCNVAGFASSVPIVVGGTTDLVRRLTQWIAADGDAAAFLQGATDPWGTRLNTHYLPSAFPGYPLDAFQAQDFSGFNNLKQYEWNPVLGGLGQVLRMTMEGRLSCLNTDVIDGQHARCRPQLDGKRSLFAVLDAGQAQAMSLPEAELPNPAGGFTTPTIESMQAAVRDMPVDENTGTQQLPYGDGNSAYAKDTRAYPLTMVQYAMLPTGGQPAAKAAAISRFVRTVTDPAKGQVYGRDPGQLALGYAGLTAGQITQARAAADHVAAQDGAKPGKSTGTGGDSGGTGTTGGDTGSGGASGTGGTGGGSAGGGLGDTGGTLGDAAAGGTGGAAAAQGGTAGPRPSTAPTLGAAAVGRASADRAGLSPLLLPVVLITGAVLLVGGPAVLLLGTASAGGGLRGAAGRLRSRLLR
ncbi:hypothetical protein ACIQBJ_03960 [Kitasatospora sp. NPDC088391]|uniref:hypothetical protein n=1 Tax=Kitasatospora sp. NPDC088391 TaxID=3364074 RepID=UPI0038230CB7